MQMTKQQNAPLRVGQRVRIINDQLYNVPGVVNAIDAAKAQVQVKVNFFGRTTAIKVGYKEVETI